MSTRVTEREPLLEQSQIRVQGDGYHNGWRGLTLLNGAVVVIFGGTGLYLLSSEKGWGENAKICAAIAGGALVNTLLGTVGWKKTGVVAVDRDRLGETTGLVDVTVLSKLQGKNASEVIEALTKVAQETNRRVAEMEEEIHEGPDYSDLGPNEISISNENSEIVSVLKKCNQALQKLRICREVLTEQQLSRAALDREIELLKTLLPNFQAKGVPAQVYADPVANQKHHELTGMIDQLRANLATSTTELAEKEKVLADLRVQLDALSSKRQADSKAAAAKEKEYTTSIAGLKAESATTLEQVKKANQTTVEELTATLEASKEEVAQMKATIRAAEAMLGKLEPLARGTLRESVPRLEVKDVHPSMSGLVDGLNGLAIVLESRPNLPSSGRSSLGLTPMTPASPGDYVSEDGTPLETTSGGNPRSLVLSPDDE